MTEDDPRPIMYCRSCKTDVVLLPNGTCQWCDTPVRKPVPREAVERNHRSRTQELHEARIGRHRAA